MPAYYDTGALVPLYVKEVFSNAILSLVNSRHEVISVHLFHRLELENALRLKVFRMEMDDKGCGIAMAKIASHMHEGKLVAHSVDWISALEEARRMGARVSGRVGCRTLDLLHVAIAVQWKSELFVTADDRQIRAARAAGLRTVDVRALPRENGAGGPPAAAAGTVRERRARYRTQK